MRAPKSLGGVAAGLAAVVALMAGPAMAQSAGEAARAALLDPSDPRILSVAHRACWRSAPENSLAALDACAALGVDLVEIDVRLTADGVPVVFHDSGLARMTGAAGTLADHDLAALRALRLRQGAGGDGAPLTDQRIPTLAEALAAARGRLVVHLDLKGGQADWDAVWRVVTAEGAEGFTLMKIVQPADDPAWREAPFLGRALVRSRIAQDIAPDLGDSLCAHQGRGLAAHTIMFTDVAYVRDAAAAHARCPGGRLWVATQSAGYAGGLTDDLALEDPEAVWGRLIDAGFTILETDRPEALVAYLRRRAEAPARLARALEPGAEAASVLVVAHRGCWRDTAENSLAAIAACVALGVDMVELDVRRTADGVLVLMHDSTVDRTTNGRGRVEDLTFAQVSALRLRAGAGGPDAPLTDAAPPTFEAAMRAARGRVLVNLDAKADVYDDAFAVLERTGALGQVVMKRRVEAGEPALAGQPPFDRVMAMPIVDQMAGPAAALLAGQFEPRPVAVEVIFTDLAYLDAARRAAEGTGARLWVNTLQPLHAAGLTDARAAGDPDGVWGRLIDAGVTLIQTDAPEALMAYLRGRGLRPD